jgi:hypothetical protein
VHTTMASSFARGYINWAQQQVRQGDGYTSPLVTYKAFGPTGNYLSRRRTAQASFQAGAGGGSVMSPASVEKKSH